MIGIGGGLLALLVTLILNVQFGHMSALGTLVAIIFGGVIGAGMSESRRELEYRGERRWRNGEDRTAEGLTEPSARPLRFGEWTINPDRSTP